MKNRKLEKYVLFLFCGLFVAAGVFFALLLGQTYREYANIKSRENYYRENLAERQENLKEKEEELRRLRHDPVYIERVIRQSRGWAKPDELVFRFEDLEDSKE